MHQYPQLKTWLDAGGGAGGLDGQAYWVRGSSHMVSYMFWQLDEYQPYARPEPVVT